MTNYIMTNYDQVGEFHLVFGHPINAIPQTNIFDENPKIVEFRLSQIKEELDEFNDAVKKRDYIECIDAICDLMYFVYGTFHVFGVNFDNLEKPKYKIIDSPENNVTVFTVDRVTLNIQHSMLIQAYSLLELSCEEKNFEETCKCLVKIELLCHTMGTLYGVNIDKCFSEVHRSNMTKVCVTEEEAQLTVESYKNDTRYSEPNYRKSETTKYWVVYDNATSKILKSVNFELPKIASVIGLNEKMETIQLNTQSTNDEIKLAFKEIDVSMI